MVAALLAATPVFAQPALPPGVELRYSARPEAATVGDRINIDFDMILPQGYQVRFPQIGNELGDFTILEFHPGPAVPESPREKASPSPRQETTDRTDGKTHHRARIVAAVYKVGEFQFESIQLSLRDGQGKEYLLSTPPIKIRIQSVLTEKDQNLKDLKKQAEIQEPVHWILWLTLAFLAALMAGLARWWWKRRAQPETRLPSQPQLDPLDLAEAELRDLLSRGLREKGFVKQFYVSLSEIIKKILEAGYSIQTFEKTTSEIMESLRNGTRDTASSDLERIEALLINCDLVKFAKYIPPKTETDATVKDTMELLESCRKQRQTPPLQPSTMIAETT